MPGTQQVLYIYVVLVVHCSEQCSHKKHYVGMYFLLYQFIALRNVQIMYIISQVGSALFLGMLYQPISILVSFSIRRFKAFRNVFIQRHILGTLHADHIQAWNLELKVGVEIRRLEKQIISFVNFNQIFVVSFDKE